MKPSITAHMMVKNDDQWVWYAIQSVLPYVDQFLITDTGSTDKTIEYINTIASPKITFTQTGTHTPSEVLAVRQQQLQATKTDWLWMVDGDEFFPPKTCQEIVDSLSPQLVGIVVRRYDCLGDVFHYQPNEQVGGYHMFGQTAHFSLRLVNCHLQGLTLQGEYPNEGFYDQSGEPILTQPKDKFYITSNRFLHMTYLTRSSIGSNLKDTLHRQKYKVEWGKSTPLEYTAPLLQLHPPDSSLIPQKRNLAYTMKAAILTPIKQLKRWILG
jgi:hypothetical protein